MSEFTDALHRQIGKEFQASQQYVAIAVHYDAATLAQLAARFYRQAVEERNHAMMMVRYLVDSGNAVEIPGIESPQTSFPDDRAPIALALEQEQEVTRDISALVELARANQEFVGEQFLGWFLAEQREEVASAAALLAVVDRAGVENMLLVEAYLAQTRVGAADPGAVPEAAGGAL